TRAMPWVECIESSPVSAGCQITYAFEQAAKRAGVPVLSPHALRHTCATLLLGKGGVQPHVVQGRLGHADISIILGLYSHVLPKQQAEDARLLGDAIYGGGR
ncbi:MAG TPA: tyrosine-type recombinase/integrase, partial [Acidimicrobiales bacterium]|nr:tyrosine-type recombinase/integrase [Acidimicrobiales bacterium]